MKNINPHEVSTTEATQDVGIIHRGAPLESINDTTTYHRVEVDGVGIFYREAGLRNAPTLVLLHGFPTSSRQFAALIPLLAPHYHVIAPDYPGFGQSDQPAPSSYRYSFDQLSATMGRFLERLGIENYTLYVHDYGAPVGFRLMLAWPEKLRALITQNGNAYVEGLGPKWAKIAEFWAAPEAHPEVIDAFLSLEGTKQRHIAGSTRPERYNPELWADEFAHLSKPGQREIQSALLYDYHTNVASYPAWQSWLRAHQPQTLIVWGANDPSFIVAGAEAFTRDLPQAELHLLNAGHFALYEENDTVARLVLRFMARHIGRSTS